MTDNASWALAAAGAFGLHFGALSVSFPAFRKASLGHSGRRAAQPGRPAARYVEGGKLLAPACSRRGVLDRALVARWERICGRIARPSVPDGRISDIIEPPKWVPPDLHVPGLPRGDGSFSVLARAEAPTWVGVIQVQISARSATDDVACDLTALIELVDYAAFSEATGGAGPETLNPDAAYKGHVLP